MTYRAPVATCRLQFNGRFTFADARAIVPYLAGLGITDLYTSPLLRPRTGSTHGYDIVDALALNPALGTDDDFQALHEELARHGMGLILDIVPNHMAASHENAWWMSVLENGPQSRYLHYFDIDWRPVAARGRKEEKVLLPVLGRPYGECLESQEIRLDFDADGFFFAYYDKRFPLAPRSYHQVLRDCADALPAEGAGIEIRDLVQADSEIANSRFLKETLWRLYEQSPRFAEVLRTAIDRFNGVTGDQASFAALDELLDAQWYRLAYWRTASETINYRRFFDVTDLVGVRVENPEVFELRNRQIFELIAGGRITGVRIDHIDGLYDPASYLARMQVRLGDPETPGEERFYSVVEKILEPGESLPAGFRCSGTTGYDFLDVTNALYVDPAGLETLTGFFRSVAVAVPDWDDLVYERKKQVIDQLFSGEMRALGSELGELAMCDRNARDFSPTELLAALVEITACMPVYRTYVTSSGASDDDHHFLGQAIQQARSRASSVDPRLFHFLEKLLAVEPPAYIEAERPRWIDFVMRWQQFTGRIMAKGVEDTAFYNDHRLISLNEVGSHPDRPADFDPVAELHERNLRIARDWPDTMNATSTHDTKRSEDVRARINVLSEIPDEWAKAVRRWMRANGALKEEGAPDGGEELMIYQTLAGVWPLDAADESTLPGRLDLFLEKALREAKTHSSWLAPDLGYEQRVQRFTRAIVASEAFIQPFRRFQRRVAFHGFLNSLSQLVVKICSPGLPDFYQGTELWDFSLVDPDNRRDVDYGRRVEALRALSRAEPASLLRRWRDGTIKMFVMRQALELRARKIDSFRGGYRAVETGTECAVAFQRGDDVLVVVPRLTTRLVKAPKLPLGEVWGDAVLPVSGKWRNVFTGAEPDSLALREVFATFPVAVLERV